MESTRSPLSALASMPSDQQIEFAEAIEAIKMAASLLSRPDVIAYLTPLKDTAQALASIRDALQGVSIYETADSPSINDPANATSVYDAVNAIPMRDAIKAVAMQDTSKAVAIQHAVTTIALREAARSDTFSEEELRFIISDDVARAIALIRRFDSAANFVSDGRLQRDRRKDEVLPIAI
jgi:hypothetical protein